MDHPTLLYSQKSAILRKHKAGQKALMQPLAAPVLFDLHIDQSPARPVQMMLTEQNDQLRCQYHRDQRDRIGGRICSRNVFRTRHIDERPQGRRTGHASGE